MATSTLTHEEIVLVTDCYLSGKENTVIEIQKKTGVSRHKFHCIIDSIFFKKYKFEIIESKLNYMI